MMILQVKVRLALRVGVSIQWRHEWEACCFPASVRSKTALAQVLLLLNLHFLRIPYATEMVRSLSQSFFEKTSIYPDSCLSDLVEPWWTALLVGKHCHETFDKTGDVPSLILPSSELHIFLSLFHCWAYEESDTEPILWWCSGCGRILSW